MPTYTRDTSNGYRLIVTSTLISQDIPNNRSRINTKIEIQSIFARAFNNTVRGRLVSNGSTLWSVNGARRSISQGETVTLSNKTHWVTHNANGEKTVAVLGEFRTITQGPIWAFPATTVTGNHVLTRIARGPRVREGGIWRHAMVYVRHGGKWRQALVYVRSAGRWRQAGG